MSSKYYIRSNRDYTEKFWNNQFAKVEQVELIKKVLHHFAN